MFEEYVVVQHLGDIEAKLLLFRHKFSAVRLSFCEVSHLLKTKASISSAPPPLCYPYHLMYIDDQPPDPYPVSRDTIEDSVGKASN